MNKHIGWTLGILFFLNSQTNLHADRIVHAPIVQIVSVHGGYSSNFRSCTSANVPPPSPKASPTKDLVSTGIHHTKVFLKNISGVAQEVRIKVTQASISGANSDGTTRSDASNPRASYNLSNVWTSPSITIAGGQFKTGLFKVICNSTKCGMTFEWEGSTLSPSLLFGHSLGVCQNDGLPQICISVGTNFAMEIHVTGNQGALIGQITNTAHRCDGSNDNPLNVPASLPIMSGRPF